MFDQGILNLLKKLSDNNYEVYLVGGVVRDYLLGLSCHDYDACTNATPSQIKEVYKDYQIFSYGEKFGTIGINYDNNLIEITTFRKEDGYVDNRHPMVVRFDATLNSDVLRRDFTINAIAYDVKNDKIIDLVGGVEDLKKGIIRSVGIAHKRFEEDSLRIIRAIRFSARFGFVIDDDTKEAILNDYELLANISKERITEEISKLLLNGFENVASDYYQVFKFLIPELEGINIGLLKIKTNELVFKLAILFSDVTNVDKAINNFRFPNAQIARTKSIIKNNDLVLNDDIVNTRILMHKLGLDYYLDLNNFHKLIGMPYTSECIISEAVRLGYDKSSLAIKGRNVKAATGFNGKEISLCIEEVFMEVVKGNLENNKEVIKEYLFNKYGKSNYLNKKIEVLKKLITLFADKGCVFSIGAGSMLYFRGIDDYFGDLDLSVSKSDYEKIENNLNNIITDKRIKWGYIINFKIDDVDIDLVVKDDDVLNNCDLDYNLGGKIIHLERLDYWYNRYKELERFKRVEQIEKYLGGK